MENENMDENIGQKVDEKVDEMPKITEKQRLFFDRYYSNGRNGTEAYRFAFDTSSTNRQTVYKEAWKLLNNKKFAPYRRMLETKINGIISKEFNYSVVEAFNALLTAQEMAFDEKKYIKDRWSCSRTAYDAPNVQAFLKAEELKLRLMGLLKDKEDGTPLATSFNVVVNAKEED